MYITSGKSTSKTQNKTLPKVETIQSQGNTLIKEVYSTILDQIKALSQLRGKYEIPIGSTKEGKSQNIYFTEILAKEAYKNVECYYSKLERVFGQLLPNDPLKKVDSRTILETISYCMSEITPNQDYLKQLTTDNLNRNPVPIRKKDFEDYGQFIKLHSKSLDQIYLNLEKARMQISEGPSGNDQENVRVLQQKDLIEALKKIDNQAYFMNKKINDFYSANQIYTKLNPKYRLMKSYSKDLLTEAQKSYTNIKTVNITEIKAFYDRANTLINPIIHNMRLVLKQIQNFKTSGKNSNTSTLNYRPHFGLLNAHIDSIISWLKFINTSFILPSEVFEEQKGKQPYCQDMLQSGQFSPQKTPEKEIQMSEDQVLAKVVSLMVANQDYLKTVPIPSINSFTLTESTTTSLNLKRMIQVRESNKLALEMAQALLQRVQSQQPNTHQPSLIKSPSFSSTIQVRGTTQHSTVSPSSKKHPVIEEEVKRRCGQAEAQLNRKFQSEIEGMKREYEAKLREQVSLLENKMREEWQKKDKQTAEIVAEFQKANAQFAQANAKLNNSVTQLHVQLDSQREVINRLIGENDGFKKIVNDKQGQILGLKTQLDKFSRVGKQAQVGLEKLLNQIESLNLIIEKLKQQNDILNKQNEHLKKQMQQQQHLAQLSQQQLTLHLQQSHPQPHPTSPADNPTTSSNQYNPPNPLNTTSNPSSLSGSNSSYFQPLTMTESEKHPTATEAGEGREQQSREIKQEGLIGEKRQEEKDGQEFYVDTIKRLEQLTVMLVKVKGVLGGQGKQGKQGNERKEEREQNEKRDIKEQDIKDESVHIKDKKEQDRNKQEQEKSRTLTPFPDSTNHQLTNNNNQADTPPIIPPHQHHHQQLKISITQLITNQTSLVQSIQSMISSLPRLTTTTTNPNTSINTPNPTPDTSNSADIPTTTDIDNPHHQDQRQADTNENNVDDTGEIRLDDDEVGEGKGEEKEMEMEKEKEKEEKKEEVNNVEEKEEKVKKEDTSLIDGLAGTTGKGMKDNSQKVVTIGSTNITQITQSNTKTNANNTNTNTTDINANSEDNNNYNPQPLSQSQFNNNPQTHQLLQKLPKSPLYTNQPQNNNPNPNQHPNPQPTQQPHPPSLPTTITMPHTSQPTQPNQNELTLITAQLSNLTQQVQQKKWQLQEVEKKLKEEQEWLEKFTTKQEKEIQILLNRQNQLNQQILALTMGLFKTLSSVRVSSDSDANNDANNDGTRERVIIIGAVSNATSMIPTTYGNTTNHDSNNNVEQSFFTFNNDTFNNNPFNNDPTTNIPHQYTRRPSPTQQKQQQVNLQALLSQATTTLTQTIQQLQQASQKRLDVGEEVKRQVMMKDNKESIKDKKSSIDRVNNGEKEKTGSQEKLVRYCEAVQEEVEVWSRSVREKMEVARLEEEIKNIQLKQLQRSSMMASSSFGMNQMQLDAVTQHLTETESKLASSRTQLTRIQSLIQQSILTLNTSQTQFTSTQHHFDLMIKNKLNELNSVTELSTKCNMLQEANQKFTDENRSMMEEMERLRGEVARLVEEGKRKDDQIRMRDIDIIRLKQQIEAFKKNVADLKEELRTSQQTLRSTIAQHQQALVTIRAQNQQALDSATAEHQQALLNIKAQHQQALDTARAQHQEALVSAAAQHQQTIQNLTQQYQQSIHHSSTNLSNESKRISDYQQKLLAQYKQQILTMRQQFTQSQQQYELQTTTKVNQLITQFNEINSKLYDERNAIRQVNSSLNKKNCEYLETLKVLYGAMGRMVALRKEKGGMEWKELGGEEEGFGAQVVKYFLYTVQVLNTKIEVLTQEVKNNKTKISELDDQLIIVLDLINGCNRKEVNVKTVLDYYSKFEFKTREDGIFGDIQNSFASLIKRVHEYIGRENEETVKKFNKIFQDKQKEYGKNLKVKNEQIQRLNREITACINQRDQAQGQVRAKQQEIGQISHQLEQANQSNQSELQALKKQMQDAVKRNSAEMTRLLGEKNKLLQDINNQKDIIESNVFDLSNYEIQIDQLKQHLSAQKNASNAQKTNLERENSTLKGELSQIKDQIKTLKLQLSDKQRNLTGLNGQKDDEIIRLKGTVADLRSKITDLQKAMRQKEEQLADLRNQQQGKGATLQKEKNTLSAQLSNANSLADNLKAQLLTANQQKTHLTQVLDQVRSTLQQKLSLTTDIHLKDLAPCISKSINPTGTIGCRLTTSFMFHGNDPQRASTLAGIERFQSRKIRRTDLLVSYPESKKNMLHSLPKDGGFLMLYKTVGGRVVGTFVEGLRRRVMVFGFWVAAEDRFGARTRQASEVKFYPFTQGSSTKLTSVEIGDRKYLKYGNDELRISLFDLAVISANSDPTGDKYFGFEHDTKWSEIFCEESENKVALVEVEMHRVEFQ